MIKKLLTNSAIYGLAPHVPKIISVLILPILTAHLTDVDYGIAGTIAAYTLALAAFSTLGFNVVLQVSFYKSTCQYGVLWREIYGFLQYWMVAFAIIQSVILYFVIPEEAYKNRWNIILLTNFNNVFFGPSALLGALYYQLKQNPIPIAVRSIIAGLLSVLVNYVCIVVLKWGYMGWYIGSFAGMFVVNISYWYVLNFRLHLSPIYCFKRKTIQRSLKVSLPTIPHYYSIFLLNTSNRLVMDRIGMPIAQIGEFNIAQQITTMADSFVNAVNMAINPMCMSAIRKGDEQESQRIVYVFGLLTLCGTFLFSLWSKEIFSILIRNQSLANTYPYAAILILALNYRPMYIAASNIYFYHEQTLRLLVITFVAGVIALIANIIFIPIYGLWAAAIINYVAFLYMGYSGFYFKFFKEKSKVNYPYVRIMILQVSLSLICFLSLEAIVWMKILISLFFLCIVSLLSYKYFRLYEYNKKNC